MKKILPLFGLTNIVVVIFISIFFMIVEYKELPATVFKVMSGYVKYSYLVAISIFVIRSYLDKKISKTNFLINIGYVGVYFLVKSFFEYLALGV